jgi:photosystem II stability/assembly factor-like uncharacterized protein
VAVGGGVYAFSAFAGGRDFGCVPLLSAKDLAESPFNHGQVDSVVASSSSVWTIYVTTADRQLFVGSGSPLVWRRRQRLVAGELKMSIGARKDTLYAAHQALYRSRDQGRTWQRLSCGLVLNTVAISPAKPRTIYLAADAADVGDGPFRVTGGLYRTTDAGRTWKRFTHFPNVNPAEPIVNAVAVSPTNPREVVIGASGGGVLVSMDNGESWRFSQVEDVGVGFDGPQVASLAFAPGAHPQLWLGSAFSGVFRGDETGLRWRRTRWPGTGLESGGSRVVADRTDPQIAYALTGMRRTTDNGTHWKRIVGLPSSTEGISISARDGSVFAWAGRQIFRSRDHGTTWTRLTPLPPR